MKLKLAVVAVVTLGLSQVAAAAWPAGGATRTIPGITCTPFTIPIDGSSTSECPFVSDYSSSVDTYWAGYNTGLYVDLELENSSAISVSACRQRWSGAVIDCATPGTASGNFGEYDINAAGFSTIGGVALSQWDYFFTELDVTSGGVNRLYGVGYY
ncbi:MAG TPA: hypothetical protein VHG72_19640 [Polyangia bacterium]|nr:hypothetical protein [Polyangia bacterium]HVZ89190.1 hypothetical protein [Polyangia bacterium]